MTSHDEESGSDYGGPRYHELELETERLKFEVRRIESEVARARTSRLALLSVIPFMLGIVAILGMGTWQTNEQFRATASAQRQSEARVEELAKEIDSLKNEIQKLQEEVKAIRTRRLGHLPHSPAPQQ
jgi:cell division protein FtsB